MSHQTETAPEWLDGAVDTVVEQLATRPTYSDRDIYVWSDGSVTGPKDSDSAVTNLHLLAQFSPGESPDSDTVRRSLIRGLRTVPKD